MNVNVKQWAIALGLLAMSTGCSFSPSSVASDDDASAPKIVYNDIIEIDGSSTVYPISAAIAEDFKKNQNTPPQIEVSFSGTGGGFEKFCAGETDINDASRPISEEEIKACDANKVRFIELPVAYDALTVVVHPDNDWVDSITLDELRTMWEPEAQLKITSWQQVRSSWPDEPLELYGPGTDSGTYDYFSEVVIEDADESRSDYVASEDDTILAKGISETPGALGYFGFAYYEENQDTLKAVPIDSGNGPVEPSRQAVEEAAYQPFARPLFIYVNLGAAKHSSDLREFVNFYLDRADETATAVGYIPLPDYGYRIARKNFFEGEFGTAFDGKPQPDLTIAQVLRKTKRFE